MKIYNLPRRAGKTYQLVSLVDMYTMFGDTPIWILGCNLGMIDHIKYRIHRINIPTNNTNIIKFGVLFEDFAPLHIPKHILVDEYDLCNKHAIETFKDYYEDRLIMFGTP